ncbi:MAG: hemolysin III family protein [Paludibacteraceae bacterium]|nr:hemolysin III family protein [Paludibacteraceae bacterium]
MSGEERANTWTHLLPAVATLLIAWPLLRLSLHSSALPVWMNVLGTALFLAGMLLMYVSSTLYHAVTAPVHKRRLRVFDHISIYVMIAGSYSVICLSVLRGWMGWSLFAFLWACVIAGVIGKFVALGKHPRLSLSLYLMMGWAALLVIWPMWQLMPRAAFWWVLAEGVFYTIGAYFFHGDEEHAYWHAIWHVFIILGSLSHTIATVIILQN